MQTQQAPLLIFVHSTGEDDTVAGQASSEARSGPSPITMRVPPTTGRT